MGKDSKPAKPLNGHVPTEAELERLAKLLEKDDPSDDDLALIASVLGQRDKRK